jgi:SAM-dependent methyltransferase
MSVFKDYAAYYDLLYQDKDYKTEVEYIHQLIQQNAPGSKSILNIGCGTGNHDFMLAELGYEVTGIDLSEQMIDIANKKLSGNSLSKISFQVGDARTLRIAKQFDVVISLFHVMSYQVSNDDLNKAFVTAKTHLSPKGVFIFDSWYGPGVLTDLPAVRYRKLENEVLKVHRIAQPIIHPNQNYVSVNYTMLIQSKTENTFFEVEETHDMRYLFIPEVTHLLEKSSLELNRSYKWLTTDQPTHDTWAAVFIAKQK